VIDAAKGTRDDNDVVASTYDNANQSAVDQRSGSSCSLQVLNHTRSSVRNAHEARSRDEMTKPEPL